MWKTIVALLAFAAVALVQSTVVSFGFAGGFGPGGGYPASFGGDYEKKGNCRLVAHRVMTPHGRRIQKVQVCS